MSFVFCSGIGFVKVDFLFSGLFEFVFCSV